MKWSICSPTSAGVYIFREIGNGARSTRICRVSFSCGRLVVVFTDFAGRCSFQDVSGMEWLKVPK